MAKKKKPESMLTRQRRLLREQRAKNAAAKKAQEKAAKAPKKLPGKGKTTANKPKAQYQRGLRRDRIARQQLENFGRAFKKTLKQGAAKDKLKEAAKGTKGKTVRTAQGKGELVKRTTNQPANQRIQRVNVKVDPPKQLPAAKTPKALPAGKTKALPSQTGRRAKAKTKAETAAKGTRGTKTNVRGGRGLPKQTPKLPPASNLKDGVRKVSKVLKPVSPALRGIAQVAGPLALTLEAFQQAEGLTKSLQKGEGIARLLSGGVKSEPLPPNAKAKPANRSERGAGSRAKVTRKKKSPQPTSSSTTPKTNRRGRPVTKPANRGLSNIPKKEGTGMGSPNDTKRVTPLKPAGKVSSTPKLSLKEAAYARDARNRDYDRLRDEGKTKEAEALGKKIAADARKKPSDSPNSSKANPFRAPQGKERKDRFSRDVAELRSMRKKQKKKKAPQSRALRVGWKGNRNY